MTSLLLLKSMLFASSLRKSKKKKKKKNVKKTAPTTAEVTSSICRICNAEKGDIPIFDNFIQPNIPEEIQNFSGVTVNKSDNLSKFMCQNCLDLLNGCIMFREMCQKTNKKMIEAFVKKEYNEDESHKIDVNGEYKINNEHTNHDGGEYKINNEHTNHKDSDDESYNIPSPTFSEDNSEIWGCTSCNKEFYNLASYDNHLSACNSENQEPQKPPEEVTKKKFLCDICGKTAFSNASLLVHMGIHENVFPFKCDQCPYQGRTMDLLKVHKRSHLVDKPFKCTQCPKTTTTSSNLAKHMRHVHSTTRPYKCTYCDKAFSYQHDMKRHIRDIHLRQGTVECDVCFKKFNTKKILQGHRWKIHKIKGERQGRLPSYLQCQMEDENENINNCHLAY